MREKWKVLSSKYLFQKPWATIRVDHVKLVNGTEIPDYYVYEYPNWVNVLATTEDDKVIIIQQYRHGLGESIYEIPAGVCDDTDKNPLESAQRELFEETGYGGGEWELLMTVSPNPGTNTNLCYCFFAKNVVRVSSQHLEPTEDIELSLMTVNEVKQLLLNDEFKQAMHAAPLWKYLYQNKL